MYLTLTLYFEVVTTMKLGVLGLPVFPDMLTLPGAPGDYTD